MSGGMRQIVSALQAESSKQRNHVLISVDIEDDKLFLLHFIIGTYFGPDFRNKRLRSAFQIEAANLPLITSNELSNSLMKRVELERVYNHILSNADPSLKVKPRILRQYFNVHRNNYSSTDFPLLQDLFSSQLYPQSRLGHQHKLIKNIVFINEPDVSCMREDCLERFKRLTGLQSFTLNLNIEVTIPGDPLNSLVLVNEVEPEKPENPEIDEIPESLEPLEEDTTCLAVTLTGVDTGNSSTCEGVSQSSAVPPSCTNGGNSGFVVTGVIAEAQAGPVVGLMDIGECSDAYLFRVSLPGVKRDERDFSCEVEDNGKVLVRGVTTTGEKRVRRYAQVFEMQTQNLCPSGHFSVSFRLPGPVCPHEFAGSFGTDGILEGIVMKKLQKQSV